MSNSTDTLARELFFYDFDFFHNLYAGNRIAFASSFYAAPEGMAVFSPALAEQRKLALAAHSIERNWQILHSCQRIHRQHIQSLIDDFWLNAERIDAALATIGSDLFKAHLSSISRSNAYCLRSEFQARDVKSADEESETWRDLGFTLLFATPPRVRPNGSASFAS